MKKIETRHYSLRTEQAYEHWMQRFVTFRELKLPWELGPEAVKEYLALKRKVSASPQTQALNGLVFLYEQAIGKPIGTLGEVTRAKRPKRLPVVLTRADDDDLYTHVEYAGASSEKPGGYLNFSWRIGGDQPLPLHVGGR